MGALLILRGICGLRLYSPPSSLIEDVINPCIGEKALVPLCLVVLHSILVIFVSLFWGFK